MKGLRKLVDNVKPTFVEGGAKAKVTSFELKSTEAGKQYYLKVWGSYAITSLTLKYTME